MSTNNNLTANPYNQPNQNDPNVQCPTINVKPQRIPFKERSQSYKIAFVACFIFENPMIFASYAGKTAYKCLKGSAQKAEEIGRTLYPTIQKVAEAVFVTFPELLGQEVTKIARWTRDHILAPVVRSIEHIAQVVITVAKHFFKTIFKEVKKCDLKPLEDVIRMAVKRANDCILPPIERTIRSVARLTFITLPNAISSVISDIIRWIDDDHVQKSYKTN